MFKSIKKFFLGNPAPKEEAQLNPAAVVPFGAPEAPYKVEASTVQADGTVAPTPSVKPAPSKPKAPAKPKAVAKPKAPAKPKAKKPATK